MIIVVRLSSKEVEVEKLKETYETLVRSVSEVGAAETLSKVFDL